MMSPSLLWEQKLGKKLKASLWVNWLKSDGDYPFTLYYTASHTDSLSRERRKHSAMQMFTADANLFHTLGRANTITSKFHFMRGHHELPGPVSYYSQVVSGQNSDETLVFAQTKWRLQRDRWGLQLLGKARYSYDHYVDTTSGSYVSDTYPQVEGYLSGSFNYKIKEWLDLDVAVDEALSHMLSTSLNRADLNVTRQSLSAVASLRGHTERFEASAQLLYTGVTDNVNDKDTVPLWQRATPFLSLMYRMGGGTVLRAFYKQTYRVPKFSELYFFYLMPRDLNPEQAHQVNLGITHSFANEEGTVSGQLTLDGYYNRVNDKIVARPTVSLYYWSMQNLGIVDILGVDATANLQIQAFNMQFNYTFQSAVDHTNPSSAVYGYQIVYTPRHSGGANLRWEHRWLNAGASAMVVGHRYSGPENSAENRLPAYCDVSLYADRKFDLRFGTFAVRVSVFNLFDTQYEVVASYPMMGRNWRVSLLYEI